MRQCFANNPRDRPDFQSLVRFLEICMEDAHSNESQSSRPKSLEFSDEYLYEESQSENETLENINNDQNND